MAKQSGSLTCALGCWLVALGGGVLAWALLMFVGGWTFLQAAFVGLVLFIVAGFLISWLICKPLPAPGSVTIEPKVPGEHPAKAAANPSAAPAAAPAAGPAVKSSQLAGQTELSERKGEWSYSKDAEAAPAPAAAAPAAAAPAADVAEEAPSTLSGPRDGGADDLKLLKGVGPKLEQTLNELGFYHFDQIAAWTPSEVAWVDTRLKFKGRIERDGWIEQAKILAAGGETEFSARKKS